MAAVNFTIDIIKENYFICMLHVNSITLIMRLVLRICILQKSGLLALAEGCKTSINALLRLVSSLICEGEISSMSAVLVLIMYMLLILLGSSGSDISCI